jgi:hypothetical protein
MVKPPFGRRSSLREPKKRAVTEASAEFRTMSIDAGRTKTPACLRESRALADGAAHQGLVRHDAMFDDIHDRAGKPWRFALWKRSAARAVGGTDGFVKILLTPARDSRGRSIPPSGTPTGGTGST